MLGAGLFAELDRKPSLSAYAATARKLRTAAADLPELRVAILANHTFDIETTLMVECARRGMRAVLAQAGYDQYRQELLNPRGMLADFGPDAVVIALHLEYAFPGVSSTTCAGEETLPETGEWMDGLRGCLASFRERSAAPALVLDFIPPAGDMAGVLGASVGRTLFGWTMELNAALRAMAATLPSVYVVGAAELACRTGLAEWRDGRLAYLARAGVNPKKFPALAAHIARHLAALRRPAAKCLVMDLDNTVWGGVLGDLGPEGIACAGSDYPASAYADFQRAALALRSRGILLAVASKNDAPLVEEAFRKRTDMPLRPEHIAEWEVHWGPKPESLERIAKRLNIGVDSLVFLDDNPAEIDLVRMTLPEVRAYQVPAQPEEYAAFLAQLEDFDQLQLSEEDRRRAELYVLRRKQEEVAAAATDLESFYRSLKTVLTPEPAGPANFERIAQLIGKTNQFNLTTRRHGKAELAARLERGSELWAFRAADMHGDHGLIGVALLDFVEGQTCEVDTLLMSCRVIGRTLETAILHVLEERAAARGARTMRGEYLPTPKNGLCREFWKQHGYEPVSESRWAKPLGTGRTACPEWIALGGAGLRLGAVTA